MKPCTLRFPDELYEETKRAARKRGMSYNSYIMMLIDLGRRAYEVVLSATLPDLQNPTDHNQDRKDD